MDAKRAKFLLLKRKLAKVTINPEELFKTSFEQQVKFIKDTSKLKVLFCTRRAAKSFTAGMYMIYEALSNPGCNCLFIGLTRSSAKSIIWKDILRTIDKRYKLKAKFNLAELTMTLPNGSVIRLTGVDTDENEMNKLLGSKYRLVCIDEASMYTIDTSKLVYGVLKPAMVDNTTGVSSSTSRITGDNTTQGVSGTDEKSMRGTICMMGTSSNFTRGLFYDITTGKEPGWSIHTWSAHDNPFVAKEWAEELEEIRTLRPLYMETPQYKQWYLNQWVVDEEKLVYKFNADRNFFSQIPSQLNPLGWTYILGVDTGWEDDNAFVLTGFHENSPALYVIKTFNKNHMTFDQVVVKINEFMKDSRYPISKVIIDGANKQGIESMRSRTSIPFEYADKMGKNDFIEMLNGDLIQGHIKIHTSLTQLTNEMMSLVWKTTGDKIVLPRREHPSLPNHLCDAFLYAWRNGFHYHSEPVKDKLIVGSKEWYEQQATDIWEREAEQLKKKEESNSGEFPGEDWDWSKF